MHNLPVKCGLGMGYALTIRTCPCGQRGMWGTAKRKTVKPGEAGIWYEIRYLGRPAMQHKLTLICPASHRNDRPSGRDIADYEGR